MKSTLAFASHADEDARDRIEINTPDQFPGEPEGMFNWHSCSLVLLQYGFGARNITFPFNQLPQLIALLQVHLEEGRRRPRR